MSIKSESIEKKKDQSESQEDEFVEDDLKADQQSIKSEDDGKPKEEEFLDDDESYEIPKKKKKKGKGKKKKEDEEDSFKEDQDEDFLESEEEKPKKKGKKKKENFLEKKRKRASASKKKKKKKAASGLLDIAAEEGDDDESEGSGEISNHQAQRLKEQYDRKHDEIKFINYVDMDDDQIQQHIKEIDERNQVSEEPFIPNSVPSDDDPKLFHVKTRLGRELDSVQKLYAKYFNKSMKKPKIFSAFCFKRDKGFIYVEAYREQDVREAVSDLSAVMKNAIKVVPPKEMAGLLKTYDNMVIPKIKENDWVRIQGGVYAGDLGQVIKIDDPINEIYVKLIPRLLSEKERDENTKMNIGEYNKRLKQRIRPKQQKFVAKNYKNCGTKQFFLLGQVITWNKDMFYDGFIIKKFKANSLIYENVDPKVDEIKAFYEGKEDQEEEEQNMEIEENNKRRRFSNKEIVRIIGENELAGLKGIVIGYRDNKVCIKFNESDDTYEMDESQLEKVLKPGDFVMVTKAEYKGMKGYIVSVEDDVEIYSDETHKNFRTLMENIILLTDFKGVMERNPDFKPGDLVKILSSQTIGYVINSNPNLLTLVDTRNQIQKVQVRDVMKIPNKIIKGVDGKRNQMSKDEKVKVFRGTYEGIKATIRNIYKKSVFLQSTEMQSNNGIFVENSDNVVVEGKDFNLADENGKLSKRNFSLDENKNLLGKIVKILRGSNYKGYQGKVLDVKEESVVLELCHKPKKLEIALDCIRNPNMYNPNDREEDVQNYAPVSQAAKTPAYYSSQRPFSNTPNRKLILINIYFSI
ncbi:MAG: hypothetical protein MJ252_22765 [archaeon]|nr:hypothetical protein [archaeon]